MSSEPGFAPQEKNDQVCGFPVPYIWITMHFFSMSGLIVKQLSGIIPWEFLYDTDQCVILPLLFSPVFPKIIFNCPCVPTDTQPLPYRLILECCLPYFTGRLVKNHPFFVPHHITKCSLHSNPRTNLGILGEYFSISSGSSNSL